jgi:hypothetical protein
MSMGKDRRRAVKASHSHSSTTHHILTPARVGIYGYMRAIYIPPYGTRGTTLTPWISKNHLFTGSQGHGLAILPPKPPSHRPTGSQAHRYHRHHPPSHNHQIQWLATITTHHHHWVLGSPEP